MTLDGVTTADRRNLCGSRASYWLCELADVHFCQSLKLGMLQPLQYHCRLPANLWAILPPLGNVVVRSDISTPLNTSQHPPTCGTTPPNQNCTQPRGVQCLFVCASITMIQSTIFYFNAFSVQLHLAINDSCTKCECIACIPCGYLLSCICICPSFSVFSPWCSCNRQTVFVTAAKRGCFVAVCLCTVL